MYCGDTEEGYYVGFDMSKEDVLYNVDTLSVDNVQPAGNYYNDDSTGELILDAKVWRKQSMMDYHNLMCSIGFETTQLNHEEEEQQEQLKYQNPMALLCLLHYSNEKSIPSEGIYACGADSDYATDDNPVLHVLIGKQYVTSEEGLMNEDDNIADSRREEEEYVWMDVPPPTTPKTFLVNLGDMMECWTNGIFKSTKHQVLSQPSSQQQQSSSSVASSGDGD